MSTRAVHIVHRLLNDRHISFAPPSCSLLACHTFRSCMRHANRILAHIDCACIVRPASARSDSLTLYPLSVYHFVVVKMLVCRTGRFAPASSRHTSKSSLPIIRTEITSHLMHSLPPQLKVLRHVRKELAATKILFSATLPVLRRLLATGRRLPATNGS